MYADLNEVEKSYKLTEFPLNVGIEVTNHCNLNCIMCNNDKILRPRGIMSMTLYKKIIDEIALENKHTRIWLDFYGEALIAGWKLYYMIDYAKRQGLTNVCINTNGILMNKEYADMLLDSNIDYISLDCDGYSEEVYENIRVKGSRELFYQNAEYLIKENKKRNGNTIIEVKIIEMEENRHEVKQVMNYWKNLGGWTAVRRRADWAINGNVPKDYSVDRIACGHAIGTMAISWDGMVAGCPYDCDCEMERGNVVDEKIKDIWKKHIEGFVKVHMEHDWGRLPTICQNCTSWMYVGEERYDEKGNPVIRSYKNNEEKMMHT